MEFHIGIDFSDFNKIEQVKTNRTILKIAKGLSKHPKELLDFKVDFENREFTYYCIS